LGGNGPGEIDNKRERTLPVKERQGSKRKD